MIRATLVIFRLACVAGLYWFRIGCAHAWSRCGASRSPVANGGRSRRGY